MIEPNTPKVSVDEMMEKVREEVEKSKKLLLQEIGQITSETLTVGKVTPKKPFDDFLWKYRTKYANIIKRLPFLKNITKDHYLRMARNQAGFSTEGISHLSNDRGPIFLEINWYYNEFLAQTKKEGLKGKIKLFIFKYFGFFAWWQGQINRVVYQELTKLREAIENKDGLIRELLKRHHDEIKQGIANIDKIDIAKADKGTVEEIIRQLAALDTLKANQQEVEEVHQKLAAIDALKANQQAVEEVHQKLAALDTLKANQQEVEEVHQKLAALDTLKANQQAVEEVHQKLAAIDALKANQQEVEEVHQKIASLDAFKADKESVEGIKQQIRDILRQIRDHKLNIIDQQRRLTLLLEEARKRLPKPIATDQIENILKENDHILDAMYVTFEDRFRGTREDIKNRLGIYLPYIAESKAGTKEAPILDVGCGRGECLELLRENGYIAKGLDINRIMVDQCQELELDVLEFEAIQYLREQKPNTLGAITGIHIVEHLPLNTLISLFDESMRVLRSGGMVIFETPNPENLIVGSCNFYADPTHRNPIPPFTLQFLLETRGFINVKIIRLHPMPFTLDNEMLQNLLFGATDYAVIGYKK